MTAEVMPDGAAMDIKARFGRRHPVQTADNVGLAVDERAISPETVLISTLPTGRPKKFSTASSIHFSQEELFADLLSSVEVKVIEIRVADDLTLPMVSISS